MSHRPHRLRLLVATAAAFAAAALHPTSAYAHADADVIAVAAGEPVTVTFRPDHGCAESPTVEVAVRVPVGGATGGEVAGWTTAAQDDGEGNTVVEWSGGSLPSDVTGTFPVTFTAPDKVGEILLFPAVQICANDEELSWVSGDPESDNPAPRLLILPPGSEEAATVDDVPRDAPGRDLLTAVIDTSTTTTTTTTAAPTDPATTTEAPSVTAAPPGEAPSTDAADSGGSNTVAVALVIGVALVLAGGGVYLWRRKA